MIRPTDQYVITIIENLSAGELTPGISCRLERQRKGGQPACPCSARSVLFEEPVDSLLQHRIPCCGSVCGHLTVDVGDITRTIPDAQAQLSSGQLVTLPEAEPLRPAFINQEIVFSLGLGA